MSARRKLWYVSLVDARGNSFAETSTFATTASAAKKNILREDAFWAAAVAKGARVRAVAA